MIYEKIRLLLFLLRLCQKFTSTKIIFQTTDQTSKEKTERHAEAVTQSNSYAINLSGEFSDDQSLLNETDLAISFIDKRLEIYSVVFKRST